MVGFANAFSTSTPCAFMETSIAAASAPKTNNAPASVSVLNAEPRRNKVRQKSRLAIEVTRLLPYRFTSQPVTGMLETAPTAELSSVNPSIPFARWSALCTAGMRESQVATTSPCTRNRTTVPHQARRTILESAVLPDIDGDALTAPAHVSFLYQP